MSLICLTFLVSWPATSRWHGVQTMRLKGIVAAGTGSSVRTYRSHGLSDPHQGSCQAQSMCPFEGFIDFLIDHVSNRLLSPSEFETVTSDWGLADVRRYRHELSLERTLTCRELAHPCLLAGDSIIIARKFPGSLCDHGKRGREPCRISTKASRCYDIVRNL
ncbi:hypothetical protein BJ170DRAFT_315542 [Xylariales sp. AK1849]|nr:hypothetical protein BJ170DRAFT_315542 [Xylariales sp. AK1849]